MVQLESGTRLGRYELLIELGQGGMASVWVAREYSRASNKQRLVALKVMLPKLAKDSTFRSMFLDEGGLVRSIQHDHVVQVYEVAENRGLLYMAMEWVEGDSLRTLIQVAKRRRAIPPEMAVRIIADTAAGLHAAHELRGWDGELRGIVHCDVSPHNILIGPSGKAKLVDFGVAHAVAQSDLEEEEEANDTIKGKFGYMSPEQALGGKFDRRSDVFSLGIVLFELTTGERLFRGRDAAHTLKLVLYGQIPRPSLLIPDYPPALEEIVMRGLERDVDKRFQTAAELQQALDRYLVSESILVSHAGVGGLAKRVLGERVKKRRMAIRASLNRLGKSAEATNLPASDANASAGPISDNSPVTISPASEQEGAAVLPPEWDLTPAPRHRSSMGYVLAALLLLGAGIGTAYLIVARAVNEAPSRPNVSALHEDPSISNQVPDPAEGGPESVSTNGEQIGAALEDLPTQTAGAPATTKAQKSKVEQDEAEDDDKQAVDRNETEDSDQEELDAGDASVEAPRISAEGFDPSVFRKSLGQSEAE